MTMLALMASTVLILSQKPYSICAPPTTAQGSGAARASRCIVTLECTCCSYHPGGRRLQMQLARVGALFVSHSGQEHDLRALHRVVAALCDAHLKFRCGRD